MKVCKPFGPTLPYEKSEYDAVKHYEKSTVYEHDLVV